ncbi:MAG TPA: DNA-processing protein DprA [Candidatus Paceibacterota bacterium]|nr:DNA-processing protein DprA [Candidatus Paceibacterota bacterium]
MRFPIRQLDANDFPPLLRHIPDAPTRLFIRGEMPPRDNTTLCVVGSRASTAYGKRMTHKLIAGLAQYPITIVSGLAFGIDSEAHRAALDVRLPTIAILPSSLDDKSLYPAGNINLAHTILLKGGTLLSENEGPFTAMIHSFPQRNRIVAGMSKATLIVEAGEKSGTLITARLALDYNREVLAIPHELDRPTGMGVNRLIREGATLVRNSNDILAALGFKTDDSIQQTALPMDLTDNEAAILGMLIEPLQSDELIVACDLSAQDANIALSSLLIRGLIAERLGKIERV